MEYKIDYGQLKLLSLSSKTIKQNITFHCKNTHVWEEYGSVKLMTPSDEELSSSYNPLKPKVIQNDCAVCKQNLCKSFYSVNIKILY